MSLRVSFVFRGRFRACFASSLAVIATLILALAWSVPSAVFAQTITESDPAYQQARQAMMAGRYAEALPEMRRAADAGLGPAQHNLGLLYLNGWGVPANHAQARRLFEAACANQVPQCFTVLGEMYSQGMGGPKNPAKAIPLFRQAVQDGNPSGDFQLGVAYDHGRGVPMNRVKALHHFQRAADRGHALAQYNAGQMLLLGDTGIPKDHDRAVLHLLDASGQDNGPALMALGFIYRSGFTGPFNLERARDYLLRAQAEGMAGAGNLLASFMSDAEADVFKAQAAGHHGHAFYGMEELCDMGVTRGCVEYGRYLIYGTDTRQPSPSKAITVLDTPCRDGNDAACHGQAFAILKTGAAAGQGRIRQARDHYRSRCDAPSPDPADCYNLAYLHYDAQFGQYDPVKAKRLSVDACFNHGAEFACPMAYHIINTEARHSGASSGSSSGDKVGTFFANLAKGMSAMSASGYNHSSGSYTSGSATSSTPLRTTNSAQDWRDFNNALRATDNIGSSYNSNCPASNPYC